jgi:hypothetical protein
MSALALNRIQQGLYAKLSGDGVLMGMVSGIFDAVPERSELPYIVIGDGEQRQEANEIALARCELTLHVWTATDGRKTALTIMERLYGLLHQGTLTIDGLTVVLMRCERAGTRLAEEGTRLHGELVIALLTEETV